MQSIPKTILERSRSLPEGGVLAPREFLHLGSRAAVDQAFSRLVKAGHLMRVCRGIYVAPARTKNRTRMPSVEVVTRSIAAQGKEAIAVSGARAAKSLGLTRKIPTQEVFLTTGRSKQLQLGQTKVTIQHAPYWMLALGPSQAGDAVRALAWIGQKRASTAAAALRRRLPHEEWDALALVRASLPCWMATAIGKASVDREELTAGTGD